MTGVQTCALPIWLEHVEEILELARSSRGEGQVTPPNVLVIRSFGSLRFERPGAVAIGAPSQIQGRGGTGWPGHGIIRWELDDNANLKVSGPMLLRSWTAGDAYPPGIGGRRVSLADLFEKERVPSWQRRNWPIVEDGYGVLWAKRFGVREGADVRIWSEE